MTITGNIKRMNPAEQITESLKKQSVHVETVEQYPQTLEIEFINDAIQKLEAFRPGDKVNISINVRGREWINSQGEAKVFNTLNGWKIERA